MPRDGSSKLPGGDVPPGPMNIGEVATPPFAVLPDPAAVFGRRQARFEALAPGHQLEPYLRFLASLSAAQQRAAMAEPAPTLPPAERIDTALANSMPPVPQDIDGSPEAFDACFLALLEALDEHALTPQAVAAVAEAKALDVAARRALAEAVLDDAVPTDAVAIHILAAAATQVHFARLAAQLDVKRLQAVADGACPACGGAPVSSMIVGWDGAHGTRFCTCSICATQWNVVRIKCLICASEKGIAYHALEGSGGVISGETCDSCKSYVKMLHQHKDMALDPLADDVASLALDLTLQREGWTRASANPFLAGY